MIREIPQSTDHPPLQPELDFLFDRINYERTSSVNYPRHFKLESMRRLLAEMGNPQQHYAIIHVAGTKGKGSVCQMIAATLNAAGIRTGVYSSPHLETIHERISLAGELIRDEQLAESLRLTRLAVQRLDTLAEEEGFRKNSFFEMITATALLHFQLEQAQKVVLETGLGGRLDSTNVCDPELCVITNISLDHTRQLGSTVDKIAREKAGIIKSGVPVVSGVLDPLAAREIHEACAVCNSDLMELDQDFHTRVHEVNDAQQTIRFDSWGALPERHNYLISDLLLNSCGLHQIANAAIAVAAVNLLSDRFRIPQRAIRQAMSEFSMIGRCEILSRQPLVLMDMAHNVASIQALAQTLQRISRSLSPAGRRKLVFATSRDKDLPGMLAQLLPLFDEIVFTRFVENPRARNPQTMWKAAQKLLVGAQSIPQMTIQPDPQLAWQMVRSDLRAADLLCVAGSAFLVAEVRPLMRTQGTKV